MGQNILDHDQDTMPADRPASDHLHLAVFAAIVGLVLLFVASAFAEFNQPGDADYLLVVVSGFFVMALGIPYVLWRVRSSQTGEGREPQESLKEWSESECDTAQGHLKGRDAAIMALLPVAAVAFGLLLIGFVLQLVEHHVV